MPEVSFQFYSQAGVKDFSALSLSSVGTIDCSYVIVGSFIEFTVAKSAIVGNIVVWRPECCGYLSIHDNAGLITNYAIKFCTTVGNDSTLTLRCLKA